MLARKNFGAKSVMVGLGLLVIATISTMVLIKFDLYKIILRESSSQPTAQSLNQTTPNLNNILKKIESDSNKATPVSPQLIIPGPGFEIFEPGPALALISDNGSTYIADVNMKMGPRSTPSPEDPVEIIYETVEFEPENGIIFGFRNIPGANPGVVQTIYQHNISVGCPSSIKGSLKYGFVLKREDLGGKLYYSLEINGIKQSLMSSDDGELSEYPTWVGDLDRDGYPDILTEWSSGPARGYSLYLSFLADKNKNLVSPVAQSLNDSGC